MKLIKDEELYPRGGCVNKCMLFRTNQHQFEHDVICEKNVRRILLYLFAFLIFFLACISSEIDRAVFSSFFLIPLCISFKCIILRIDKSIHWINDVRTLDR